MRGIAVCCLTAAIVALAPVPAAAQNGCTEPTSSEWLRQAPNPEPPKRLSDDQVFPVAHELPEAIARLERSPAVPLRDPEVQKFLGRPAPDADRKLRAYLIRAVFPSAHSMVHVRRDGSRLDIFSVCHAAFLRGEWYVLRASEFLSEQSYKPECLLVAAR
jgi:hypothetical protein